MSSNVINIPNVLTILRVLMTPLFAIFLLNGESGKALLVFAGAAVTDGLDGLLARCLHQKTEFGAFLDPLADKLLVTTAFMTMAFLQYIPKWLAVIVIFRDVIIAAGVLVFQFFSINFEIRPSLFSKCTTFFQLSTIVLILFETTFSPLSPLRIFLFHAVLVFTILSGIHYICRGMRILHHLSHDKGDDQ